MILGGVGAILTFLFVPVAQFFIWICFPLLWFFEKVVRFFGEFNLSVKISTLPIIAIIGYYIFLISVIIFLKKLKKN
jgi:hypothetical protein